MMQHYQPISTVLTDYGGVKRVMEGERSERERNSAVSNSKANAMCEKSSRHADNNGERSHEYGYIRSLFDSRFLLVHFGSLPCQFLRFLALHTDTR